MPDTAVPTIGFIGWNPFQLVHVRKLVAALPGACFVLERRKDYIDEFNGDLLTDPQVPVLVWNSTRLAQLDGVFDVLVCQTPFPKIESFRRTRIAMLQYGYAKEAHNYGPWRAFADLTLAYGPYAADKISHFSPAVPVGNPRFDDWHLADFHSRANERLGGCLDPSRKTVLYAPTWGDLSSVDRNLAAVYALADEYNVLVKMHHNTELLEPARKRAMAAGRVQHFGANDDLLELLALADVVVSDYSGAIFDAVFCQKPVVLLDGEIDASLGHKVDLHSLEYARRDEIGMRVSDPSGLRAAVAQATGGAAAIVRQAQDLRAQLFTAEPGATQRAANALLALASGQPAPGQMHSYMRKCMVELHQLRAMGSASPAPAPYAGAEKRVRFVMPGLVRTLKFLGAKRAPLLLFDRFGAQASSVQLLREMISLAKRRGDAERRSRYIEWALRRFPSNTLGYLEAAQQQVEAGDFDKAHQTLVRAPDSRRIKEALAWLDGLRQDKGVVVSHEPPLRNLTEPGAGVGRWPAGTDWGRRVWRSLKRSRMAAPVLNSLPSVVKQGVNHHLLLADSHAAQRDQAAALRVLLEAQKRHPNDRRLLLRISAIYRDDGQTALAYTFVKAAQACYPGYGSVRRLTFEADHELFDEAAQTLDRIAALAPKDWLQFMPMLNRVSVFFPEHAERMAGWREAARRALMANAPGDKNELEARVQLAVKCRWVNEALELVRQGRQRGLRLSGATREWLDRVRTSLEPMAPILDLASRNEQGGGLAGVIDGRRVALDPGTIDPDRIVEFFIPTVFFSDPADEKPSYRTVRAALRHAYAALLRVPGLTVVPRYQYNWRHCVPRLGGRSVSYHTRATYNSAWLHIQESPLAGRCSVDPQGFAGYSSLANGFSELEAHCEGLDQEQLLRNHRDLHETYVAANVSKYEQAAPGAQVSGPYVFVALQIPTDTVADLADVDGIQLLHTVARHYAGTGIKVIAKRHPYCNSLSVQRATAALQAEGLIELTEASVHELIAGAQAVFTVNSGVGLEALIHLKPVVVTGDCDYAYGVAARARSVDELARILHAPLVADTGRIYRLLHYYVHRFTVCADDTDEIDRRIRAWLAVDSERATDDNVGHAEGPASEDKKRLPCLA
ncbi:CDP-glycerol glycerophosphotransferase family protein [Aquabacterium sp. A7-Y]|uniref:CDP-glycerol glycerophosphotransferase family protein n=1 Tax=Aquabacterium sp. A7-Y TaxID=1349605 RepID=UPI00223D5B48|nr:CDP-glycerol glycerophosphotransferase family protein [Aquabacterium sp. A7-Y]MCW7538933.1 CDP-glycerol glycerophosphotransferase family protein [Aquabacterium sp. A7-Y]